MKRAVSISLGSSSRDKKVVVEFKGEAILVERIGTDGDVEKAKHLYAELDGQVDAFGVGGVDLYLRLDRHEYPLRAALKLVEPVKQTPVVDGRGLKHTLERRVFELAAPALHNLLGGKQGEIDGLLIDGVPHFRQAFIPVAVDRIGLARAVSEVSQDVIFGDLMVALDIPLPVHGLRNFKRVARLMLPFVSHFPMSLLFYGSSGTEHEPKYQKYWLESDLLAGDFLFMKKYLPQNLNGKTVITNTTTAENVEFLRQRGVYLMITTTPRYDGRSFGTNLMEAALTAYAGKGRPLSDTELNQLIDHLDLRPSVELL
ncbi:MAG: quinate 5-dehydrogenase [Anaerolineae bacterium]|nr:quinate 5-dehydrogenase [Anaerolineae bacterium]MBL6964994.1 quinate 5-dehydrogenase [Anaerolineales bacterium]